ncbi:cor protein [Salmonella enterica]|uniref:Cor protein n=1 Tax=Salmonella enterica subsp. arizonae serovar 48:z4,z24:- TaxID=1967584 RepID=A0A739C3F9_SALER|nr:cor protein [Salmonella enterica]EBP3772392.1 cor protein [Salmonella enterica subsp. arizonae]EDS2498613.1 cor protein [Salmonella enterica subsp. arizonae serovar 51:z4,z23:-]EDU0937349.1 cor protein [Salmonella enterica subsp. arizonae serovar 48:z4,z24:-]EDX3027211.1 cor protein [Salmonella enterica subsp. houtenae serovar 48:g,z51:-]
MKQISGILLLCFLISSCSSNLLEKQNPVCEAEIVVGGQEQTVQIYDVRQVANQVEYKAGYPFNWRWVSKNNFTRSTCSK